ncbi:SLIT and NTRK-like protein 6 [Trichomycterus rosablanca]|uniref:SLIT and NTRK-like protein 6 n=1 Tax=Trichomycterus rosablanca TaxID=2290929 RepID=UPI002F35A142
MKETRNVHRLLFLLWFLFVLHLVSGSEGNLTRCECSQAIVTFHFPPSFPNHSCCLNFSGSLFSGVSWEVLKSAPGLEILDLSICRIQLIHRTAAGSTPPLLRELYLNQNQLQVLPSDFLIDAFRLKVLDLGQNLLKELPTDFLKNAGHLQVLILSGNRLKVLPVSVLRLALLQFDLFNNPWSCSCSMVESFYSHNSSSNSSSFQNTFQNLTCSSPQSLQGRMIWSIRVDEVCRLSGLNALFILLPLLLLMILMFCWCCGRKEEKKDSLKFSAMQKKNLEPFPSSINNEVVLKNQLMLRPSSALLGSVRDVCEEVEVRLGSVESLECPSSTSSGKEEEQELDSKQDLDTVSVSEVMRDSADREKAYMVQSTKYYSLVPGMEMEDSDHGEYEDVDLS